MIDTAETTTGATKRFILTMAKDSTHAVRAVAE